MDLITFFQSAKSLCADRCVPGANYKSPKFSIWNVSKRTIAIAFFFASIVASAQNDLKIIPPSPNAAAFAKYGNIPVSTYTGVPNITVPIYEIKTRDITVPINLSYHASGIKVSEEASRVGLGWTLNCGGVITRNVVNRDDFVADPMGYLSSTNPSPSFPETSDYYTVTPEYAPDNFMQRGPNFVFPNEQNPAFPITIHFNDYIYDNYDFEPDQFSYNFFGNSGKFILDRDGNVVLENQQKIKFRYLNNGESWELKTADGFTYLFEAYEYFKDYQTSLAEQKSAWYLTEIISPGGEHVNFHYGSLTDQFIRPVGVFQESVEADLQDCVNGVCTPNPPSQSLAPRKVYSNIYLESVTWDLGRIEFVPGNRVDIEGDIKVDRIKIFRKNESVPVKEYVLNYDYFSYALSSSVFPVPDLTTERLTKRLKLVSLTEKGSDSSPVQSTTFSYYENSGPYGTMLLPQKNSFAQDHWGYSNGKTNNTSFIPTYTVLPVNALWERVGARQEQRDASSTYASAYSLKDITYPTGGKTTFHYGINRHEVSVTDLAIEPDVYKENDAGSYASTESRPFKTGVFDLTTQYERSPNTPFPAELKISFHVANNSGSYDASLEILRFEDSQSVAGPFTAGGPVCSGSSTSGCVTVNEIPGGTYVRTFRTGVVLPPGKYIWKARIGSAETNVTMVTVDVDWWVDVRKRPDRTDQNIHYRTAGGLRIEKIEDFDPVSNQPANVRKYIYEGTSPDSNGDGIPEKHSSGKLMVPVAYSSFDVTADRRDAYPNIYNCYWCIRLERKSQSNLPLMGGQGNIVGYTKVTELFGENGEGGSIAYEYENVADKLFLPVHPGPEVDGLIMRPGTRSTLPNPLNGRLLKKTTYSNAGVKLMEDTISYAEQFVRVVYGMEIRPVLTKNNVYYDQTLLTPLLFVYPSLRSAFSEVVQKKQTVYSGSQTLTTISTYTYASANHLQLTETSESKSDGTKVITTYKYPADYSGGQSTSTIDLMKNDDYFMHGEVIEKTTWKEDVSSTRTALSREITIYDLFADKIFPKEKARLTNTTALTTAELGTYIPSAGYDPLKHVSEYTLDYNAQGNIYKVQRRSESPIFYLWGYDNSLPVAEFQHALPSEIFYTSFEESGTPGNSTIPAGAGRKYNSGGSYTIPFTPVPGKTYKVSYRYYSDGQWHSKVTDFVATINDGEHLDEVRVYPVGTQLKTYTYDPVVGMLSSTDPNGRITQLEYDAVGRLKLIRDDQGMILKTYQYNYVNKTQP
jgi:YD repeat-containing protein